VPLLKQAALVSDKQRLLLGTWKQLVGKHRMRRQRKQLALITQYFIVTYAAVLVMMVVQSTRVARQLQLQQQRALLLPLLCTFEACGGQVQNAAAVRLVISTGCAHLTASRPLVQSIKGWADITRMGRFHQCLLQD
jgi:hypothetical protein